MTRFLHLAIVGTFVGVCACSTVHAQSIMAGDLVLGLNSSDGMTNVELARGPAMAMGGVNVPFGWDQASLQAIEFDNLNGISHNPQGNLLGASFGGGAPSGGAIFSLGTCSTASETIGDTVGLGGSGVSETPLGGLSVSPDNTKIALVGYSTGRVIVYDYSAGDCTGTGASLSNGRESEEGTVVNGATQGTIWFDNNNVIALSASGDVVKVDATTMETEVVATVDTIAEGSQFTDVEYNPAVAPFLYLSYSTFSGATTNKLFVLDPRQDFDDVISIDLSASSQTAREIALSAAGDLYIGQFGASVDILLNAADADFDDNSSLDWYTPIGGSPSFSGLDVAVGLPIMTPGLPCDFDDDGICNVADIDSLTAEIIAGTNNTDFDVNGDGVVNLVDQDQWRADAATENGFAAPFLNGDADLNGSVVAGDLNALGTNWQSSPNAWSNGDFNADGVVNSGDLNLLALNWQDSIATAAAAAVPEPATTTLLLMAICLGCVRRCRMD
jgi:hypothetical protein